MRAHDRSSTAKVSCGLHSKGDMAWPSSTLTRLLMDSLIILQEELFLALSNAATASGVAMFLQAELREQVRVRASERVMRMRQHAVVSAMMTQANRHDRVFDNCTRRWTRHVATLIRWYGGFGCVCATVSVFRKVCSPVIVGNQVVQHLARYSEIATCRLARIVGRSRVAEDVKVLTHTTLAAATEKAHHSGMATGSRNHPVTDRGGTAVVFACSATGVYNDACRWCLSMLCGRTDHSALLFTFLTGASAAARCGIGTQALRRPDAVVGSVYDAVLLRLITHLCHQMAVTCSLALCAHGVEQRCTRRCIATPRECQ